MNQWDLLEAIDGWPAATRPPARTRSRWPADADGRGADRAAARERPASTAAHELIVVHVSAGNPFRRWPEPAFIDAGRGARGDVAEPADRAELRPVGSGRGRARIAAAARTALGRAATGCVEFGEFDLAELRALVERSRLFIGGDTGPAAHCRHHRDADSGNIWTDASPRGRRPGAIRGSRPNRSKSQGCRAGRAISGSVSLAIFDV